MQIRFNVNISPSEYVSQGICEKTELKQCPFHPNGGCGIRKHGTYTRKWPIKLKIPRWYCRMARKTISKLPDFLACRLSGTLQDVEEVVIKAQTYPSQEQAAAEIRPDIQLPGALRWLRRRFFYVQTILTIAAGILSPNGFRDLTQLKEFFSVDFVLPHLRAPLEPHLQTLTQIIGFSPPSLLTVEEKCKPQHGSGMVKPP